MRAIMILLAGHIVIAGEGTCVHTIIVLSFCRRVIQVIVVAWYLGIVIEGRQFIVVIRGGGGGRDESEAAYSSDCTIHAMPSCTLCDHFCTLGDCDRNRDGWE
jgi:hypothetical protein